MSTWSDYLISKRVSDEPSFTRSEQRKLGGKGKVSPGTKRSLCWVAEFSGLFFANQSVSTRLNIVAPCWYSYLEGLLFNSEGLLLWWWLVMKWAHLLSLLLMCGSLACVVFCCCFPGKLRVSKLRAAGLVDRGGEHMWNTTENVPFAPWASVPWKILIYCNKGKNRILCTL